MALLQESVAAATAVVGYDVLRDNLLAVAQYSRRLVAGGLAGSAAALDTIVDLYVGAVFVARMYNSATGAVLVDAHMYTMRNITVPAGVRLQAKVVDAPASNVLNMSLETDP
jgi:hypothetical protein